MIQVYVVTAQLGQVDGDRAVRTLRDATIRIARLHPSLRSSAVEAADGVLTMTLRVAGRTRWHVQGDARKIATSMLRRVDLDVAGAKMELERTMPSAKNLTKVQGRGVTVTARVPSGDQQPPQAPTASE